MERILSLQNMPVNGVAENVAASAQSNYCSSDSNNGCSSESVKCKSGELTGFQW